MTLSRWIAGVVLTPMCFVLVGCGDSLPKLIEVEGIVLLGGQPLPHALVTFNPTATGLPPDNAGTAVTDADGKFKLSTAGKPGVVPGEHIVTVREGPPPEETRGEEGQEKLSKHLASLKNRPIPPKYSTVSKSGVSITVKADLKDYKVELTR